MWGLPNFVPRRFASARAAFVRLEIVSRSCSATAARMNGQPGRLRHVHRDKIHTALMRFAPQPLAIALQRSFDYGIHLQILRRAQCVDIGSPVFVDRLGLALNKPSCETRVIIVSAIPISSAASSALPLIDLKGRTASDDTFGSPPDVVKRRQPISVVAAISMTPAPITASIRRDGAFPAFAG